MKTWKCRCGYYNDGWDKECMVCGESKKNRKKQGAK